MVWKLLAAEEQGRCDKQACSRACATSCPYALTTCRHYSLYISVAWQPTHIFSNVCCPSACLHL